MQEKNILFTAKHSWMTFTHGQTIIYRQLLAGHVRGGLSANEKEEKFALNDNVIYKKKSDFPCFF